jgi:hypothetical protein
MSQRRILLQRRTHVCAQQTLPRLRLRAFFETQHDLSEALPLGKRPITLDDQLVRILGRRFPFAFAGALVFGHLRTFYVRKRSPIEGAGASDTKGGAALC